MKLCVFFGTFNPIHNVHLAMAEFVIEKFHFDKILFVPGYIPPHKEIDKELAGHRYNMVKAAIEGNSSFCMSDIEYKYERKSYTYNTILEIYDTYKTIDGKINFIIGSDAFKSIEHWYKTDKLKEIIDFTVFPREANFDPKSLDCFKEINYNFQCVDMPYDSLSSTELRTKIEKGLPIESLIPPKVGQYIEEHRLYRK